MSANPNRKAAAEGGMTLIEVMIALLVLLMVSLALMQTALLSIDSNVKNVLRDEAVTTAEAQMDELRNTDFDALANNSVTITANIRNVSIPYVVNSTVTDINTNNKRIDVEVFWQWKGEGYSHRVSSLVRRQ